MARIGLVFGGRSVEHEVSVTSARTVASGLGEAGHEVVALGIGPDGVWADRATSEAALAGELDRLPAGGGPVAPSLRAPARGRGRRGVPRSSTAPGARTAPSRACSRWPTCPTSAPG